MTRYWVAWWSGSYADDGCTKPPFPFWMMEHRPYHGNRWDAKARDELALTAMVDAEDEASLWETIRRHFPDAELRWAEPKPAGWDLHDQFPQWMGLTGLAGPR